VDLNATSLLAEPAAFAAGVAALQVPARAVRARRGLALVVLAVVAGVAAATASGKPTGWAPLDLVLLAAVGAAAVLAGSEANSLLLLAAAAVAAVGGTGSAALPLALGAAGLVLAGVLVGVEPLLDATAAGLVAQAALRLDDPGGRGLTALVAAVILVPIVVSGAAVLDRAHRRLLVRIGLGVAAFGVVGALAGAAAAASAVGPLRRGLSAATATIDATNPTGNLQTTTSGLTDAGRNFAAARHSLDAWWALPARAVPVVAQHWRVLHAAALTGDQLATAGRRALDAPALANIQLSGGRVPLDQLAAVDGPVGYVVGRATAARRRLDAARSDWLVPALSKKLDAELERVRGIEKSAQLAQEALPLVPRLLGADGPRRYFLAVQTPDESRAGGGFLGNYGEITADDGRLTLTRFGRQDDLNFAPGADQRKLVAPADYTARYARFRPDVNWSNVNLSPDFPTDAQVIEDLYPQSGGAPIDGVIAIDPAGLAALLGVVGTIEVPEWPTPISAANALQVLLYDQYGQYDAQRDARVDFLGDVAQVAWKRFTGGQLPAVPQLLATFGPAVRDKHLMFSSTRPDEQRLFEDMGAAGKVAPVSGDFIGLVTQNAVGNKIDYFLRRDVDYRAQLNPATGRVQATAKISVHNDAPASGVDVQLIGNDLVPRLPPGTNKLYLSFYSPWSLVQGRVDGQPVQFERATEIGRQVYSTALVIPPSSTVVVELDLSGKLPKGKPYRLDIYRQPTVSPDLVTTTLSLPPGWRTTGGREQTSSHRLEADATVDLPVRRR
jgi:hypothetical protein